MRLVPPKPSPTRASLALVVSAPAAPLSDAEVARGLARGEDWAITEAWQRFAPLVLTMAERALGSKSDAEDLAQEVFSRLYRRAPTLRDAESLRSFVYSIAVRTLRSELRYRRLKAWLTFRGPETLVDLRYSTPDVEARDLLRNFYALLDRLSARDRLVFTLRRVESMTVQEIALATGLSASTVKRSLAHATERLSRWIEADPRMFEHLGARFGGRDE
jgi:RNA polymerase sigma-70 factor (ECF subfamily)